jgi:hypothetical protein
MQLRSVTAAVLLASAAGASHAALTLYTSEAAYLAAVGATVDYRDFSPSPVPPAVVSGVSFGSVSRFGSCSDPSSFSSSCAFNVLHSSNAITDTGGSTAPNGVASLIVSVRGPEDPTKPPPRPSIPFSGVGFNYISGGITALLILNDFGDVIGSIDTTSASGFIGLVSDVPLDDRLRFVAQNALLPSGGNDRYFIDDFRVNSAATVPEPASYGLVALGVVGIALSRRRRAS